MKWITILLNNIFLISLSFLLRKYSDCTEVEVIFMTDYGHFLSGPSHPPRALSKIARYL